MLNPALDIVALRAEWSRDQRLRVRNVLAPGLANAIEAEMAALRYQLFCHNGAGVAVLDPAEIASWPPSRQTELREALMAAASEANGFAYNGVRMSEIWGRAGPDTPLGRLNAALHSPEVRAFVEAVTGRTDWNDAFAQATRYIGGHYLPWHVDDPKNENKRRLAFVWGFTRRWLPDWGGLLQFYDTANEPAQALIPGFDTLDLFDVRHRHAVTYVAPFAKAPRLAVSGWFVETR